MGNQKGKRDSGSATLYVVSTPIGNLEDLTLRAIQVLKSVDLIAAESVQHTRGLCRHFAVTTRLTSYNQHNRRTKAPALIARLKSGSDVALVSNAGTPAISDPGIFLVNQALERDIRVSPIPGPSAVTAALSVSGLRSDGFVFAGFLPNRSGKRRRALEGLEPESRTLVFFEAPHRFEAMLSDMLGVFGDRPAVLLRELTKVFEQVTRGSIASLAQGVATSGVKGELTLVVAGKERATGGGGVDEKIQGRIADLLQAGGLTVRDIATQLSVEEGVAYRDIYRDCLAMKRKFER
jgi:16S rRNA (cytidine1402-2'-O)-methyltransferase